MPELTAVEIVWTSISWIVTVGVFFVAAYAAIVLVKRILHRSSPTTPLRDPALDALRTRLASGEIDEVEYERLRTVLQRA